MVVKGGELRGKHGIIDVVTLDGGRIGEVLGEKICGHRACGAGHFVFWLGKREWGCEVDTVAVEGVIGEVVK